MRALSRLLLTVIVLGGLGALGWKVWERFHEEAPVTTRRAGPEAAPVEVAPIRRGEIELRRTISGTLETPSEIVVAPKIAGFVERIGVDLADEVERGQVVAWIDDDELQQAVHQVEAELEVARANLGEAEKALQIATRGLERVQTLKERGVASDVQYDQAFAEKLAKEAAREVADAQVARAEANLEGAKIRAGYTQVAATWAEGADKRIVAERYVDEGQTVAANTPLLRIVELNPLVGVIYVTEKDYGALVGAPPATLTTDAYPGETFTGTITRISPVLRQSTRQARVELRVENPDLRLRPGMFIRATLVLASVEDATIVPVAALTQRGDRTGVFVVDEEGPRVLWRPVETGIREGGEVEVRGEGLEGRVVTLGQQLVDDGSAIRIPHEGKVPGE